MEKNSTLYWILNILILVLWSLGISCLTQVPRTNRSDLCNTGHFILNSNFIKSCSIVEKPTYNTNLTENSFDSFLCLGIDEALYRVCYLESVATNFNKDDNKLIQKSLSLIKFNNSTEFDEYLKKEIKPLAETDKSTFCNNLSNLKPSYKKIKHLFSKFTDKISVLCPLKCYNLFTKELESNSLCVFLYWCNQLYIPKQSNTSENTVAAIEASTVLDTPSTLKKIPNGKTTGEVEKEILVLDLNTKKSNLDNKNEPKDVPNYHMKQKGEKLLKKVQLENTSQTIKTTNNFAQNNAREKSVDMTKLKDNKQEAKVDAKANANAESNMETKVKVEISEKASEENENAEGNLERNIADDTLDIVEASSDLTPPNMKNNETPDIPGNCEQGGNCNTADVQKLAEQTVEHIKEAKGNLIEQNVHISSNRDTVLPHPDNLRDEEESHFFTYFTVTSIICIAGYIGYHNKQKIIAMLLEGRRSKNNRNRRRPSTASYRKLDCNLEEAVTSQCNANVTHVIY